MLKPPAKLSRLSPEVGEQFKIVDQLTEAYFTEDRFHVTLPPKAFKENVGTPISAIPGNFEDSAEVWAKGMHKWGEILGRPALDAHALDMVAGLLEVELGNGMRNGTPSAEQVPARVGQIIANTLYFEATERS